MDKNIEDVVKSCQKCQINQSMPHQAPVHNWENTIMPWARVHIDYDGPYLGKMFFIIVDLYSKWIDVFPTSSSTSKSTIEKLRICFANHGIPQVCVSDNGSNFVSDEFKCFMELNGIRHITSALYHPRMNGCTERAVRTFKNNMEKLNRQESIQTAVSRFLFNYRITPQTTTGKGPCELLMNRQLNSRLNIIKPNIGENRTDYVVRSFVKDDLVWVRNYARGEKWISGQITQKTGTISYKVKTEFGELRKHIDQLRSRKETDFDLIEKPNHEIDEDKVRRIVENRKRDSGNKFCIAHAWLF